MSLPVVELKGTPYEQGLAHGGALRDEILHNLRVYFDRFEREVDLDRDELLARTRRYLEVFRGQSEDYMQGMRGLADAAGVSLDEIAFLNLRYELLYFSIGRKKIAEAGPDLVDGCSNSAKIVLKVT